MGEMNIQSALNELKQQIQSLKSKEAVVRTQLYAAMSKLKKLGFAYKGRLLKKMKETKQDIAKMQSAVYLKVAREVDRQIMKRAVAKSKAFSSALAKAEKKLASNIEKSFKKKPKTRSRK